jgi:hypothetical protein
MAVVTLIWVGMFGAVAYLAAQNAHKLEKVATRP